MHLDELRTEMSRRSIDVYVVPTSDFHNSEYVGDYFKARAFLTGFTGSAGTAVVTADTAGLWTDGRYFIQAAEQLAGSGFSLYRMNEEGVPAVGEFVKAMRVHHRGEEDFNRNIIGRGLKQKLQNDNENECITGKEEQK